mmetsp:Transcript_6808/g.11270  ORF Transcript_6808/g.11270 Transcript_6808/m.11270 type:complete len:83 (-) Transcript_6808:60-308(-)
MIKWAFPSDCSFFFLPASAVVFLLASSFLVPNLLFLYHLYNSSLFKLILRFLLVYSVAGGDFVVVVDGGGFVVVGCCKSGQP